MKKKAIVATMLFAFVMLGIWVASYPIILPQGIELGDVICGLFAAFGYYMIVGKFYHWMNKEPQKENTKAK